MAKVRDLVRVAVRAALEKKATDVRAIDVRGISSVTDYMVIASGSSDTNVRAIAENVREKLHEKRERPFSLEGLQEGAWVLLDYVDFVVHVFLQEKRAYFGLEELWADAKPVPIAEEPAARAVTRAAARPATAALVSVGEAPPQVPRTALKPAAKKSAPPKKTTAKQPKAAAGKRIAAAGKAAVPKPKKAAVPKRGGKG